MSGDANAVRAQPDDIRHASKVASRVDLYAFNVRSAVIFSSPIAILLRHVRPRSAPAYVAAAISVVVIQARRLG